MELVVGSLTTLDLDRARDRNPAFRLRRHLSSSSSWCSPQPVAVRLDERNLFSTGFTIMTTKEKTELEKLQDICETAIGYVGSANYLERESTANRNVERAFNDFRSGRTVKPWDDNL